MRVYLAGPYTLGCQAANVRAAVLAADRLLSAGHAPCTPHLSHLADLLCPRPYEDWLRLCLAWLAVSEALVRLPGRSEGADREEAEARRLGLPVYVGVDAFLLGRVLEG
jgi:hypothetical protein